MAHPLPRPQSFARSVPLRGTIRVPGDKSISHRALMLAALAIGESVIDGLLEGEDVLATAAAMRAMGADVVRDALPDGSVRWRVHGVGVGGLLQPQAALEMGNSGTSTRLLMGLVASHPISCTFTGDASLSRRPMGRVIDPLSRMGAEFTASPGGRLPLMVRGICPAVPIEYRLPVASAQVKSAVLLAGLNTPGITRVIEPVATRDHSERMLKGFGAGLTVEQVEGARIISIRGEAELRAQAITVPGDPSSAAFPVVAALLVPGSEVTIANVGLNPTRAGLFEVLRAMGGDIRLVDERTVGGEPVADLVVRHSALRGMDVPPELAPSMIDEFPILFVAAAMAEGRTVMRGLEELRVKESDRLTTMATGLRACGVGVEELPDGLIVAGRGGDPLPGGATVAAMLDHRIAMSFAVAGLIARDPITIDDIAPVATSFPGFQGMLAQLTEWAGPPEAAAAS
ncbi:MAG: aroA [Sphingomonas bacterium]|nr:3-phosphoshikimate 1-carboxyvinyltransferase [Sphingomonas bacterium]MDB5689155.1 aroA [Sphingomonas bacterium]